MIFVSHLFHVNHIVLLHLFLAVSRLFHVNTLCNSIFSWRFHICFMLTTLCNSIFSWSYMIVSQLKINNSQKLNTTDMGFIHLPTHDQGFTDQFKITEMSPSPHVDLVASVLDEKYLKGTLNTKNSTTVYLSRIVITNYLRCWYWWNLLTISV